jgi:membrane protein
LNTREVLKDTARLIIRAQLFMAASSLAYTTILSVIPLLAVSFAVFQIFGGMTKIYGMIEPVVLSNLAGGVGTEVTQMLEKFIQNAHGKTLGFGGLIGLVVTSISMLSSIERAINRAWEVPIKRSWTRRISYYGLFITLGPFALAVAIGISTSKNFPIAKILPHGGGLFLVTACLLIFSYKTVPDTRVSNKHAVVAGLFTSVLLTILHLIYHYFTYKFLAFGRIYGSLSAIPIILLWVFVIWLITLIGAALTASMQRMTSQRAA